MKEDKLIKQLAQAKNERLQNNQMIQSLNQDVNDLQQMVSGFLGVIRLLHGYDDAITTLSEQHKAAEAKAALEAQVDLEDSIKEIEVETEEVKVLDLGKDD
jgi:uncharacterized coiled-coil DUF342 family protein